MTPAAGFPLRDLAWRTAFRIGFPLARLWWHLLRRPHRGAAVVIHVGQRLLLLRLSYRREWNFPGGGIHPGESPDAAARRELCEEIGLVAADLAPTGEISGTWDGRPDHVHMFELRLAELPALALDNREIVAARLVGPAEALAMPLTGPVVRYLRRAEMPPEL